MWILWFQTCPFEQNLCSGANCSTSPLEAKRPMGGTWFAAQIKRHARCQIVSRAGVSFHSCYRTSVRRGLRALWCCSCAADLLDI
ncbi:hypothetical protein CA54_49880 [Symmachiella macrocystis]|uniref:Uncharacterized protein n=1 Tax=Symmachiella macrocystis TaxID=2527985 RepID=A0A5C6B532_9PLAN|nr:hypothetical protein CA54_49880 [Symmachiella macrocystis]